MLAVSDESYYSEASTCRRLSLKEIYSATENLSMSNFIGQGIAGKAKTKQCANWLSLIVFSIRGTQLQFDKL